MDKAITTVDIVTYVQWRRYLGWHPVRKLVVSPHRSIFLQPNTTHFTNVATETSKITGVRRGISHDSDRLFSENPRIIHRAELVVVEESPKRHFCASDFFYIVRLRDQVGVTPKKVAPGAARTRRPQLCYATANIMEQGTDLKLCMKLGDASYMTEVWPPRPTAVEGQRWKKVKLSVHDRGTVTKIIYLPITDPSKIRTGDRKERQGWNVDMALEWILPRALSLVTSACDWSSGRGVACHTAVDYDMGGIEALSITGQGDITV
ncbi:hypothetical protein J6590_046566 [Homalodisca vitripennis]|nr:hypothetical protein J6590_046566 [Homalodisca vitripennis]